MTLSAMDMPRNFSAIPTFVSTACVAEGFHTAARRFDVVCPNDGNLTEGGRLSAPSSEATRRGRSRHESSKGKRHARGMRRAMEPSMASTRSRQAQWGYLAHSHQRALVNFVRPIRWRFREDCRVHDDLPAKWPSVQD